MRNTSIFYLVCLLVSSSTISYSTTIVELPSIQVMQIALHALVDDIAFNSLIAEFHTKNLSSSECEILTSTVREIEQKISVNRQDTDNKIVAGLLLVDIFAMMVWLAQMFICNRFHIEPLINMEMMKRLQLPMVVMAGLQSAIVSYGIHEGSKKIIIRCKTIRKLLTEIALSSAPEMNSV